MVSMLDSDGLESWGPMLRPAAGPTGRTAAVVGGVGLLLEFGAFHARAARHLIMMKIAPLLRQGAVALLVCFGAGAYAQSAPADATPEPSKGERYRQLQDLIQRGQAEAALAEAEKLLAARPKDAQARFVKGVALSALNRTDAAVEVFVGLTEDYPELPEPYNNLAVIYAQQNQYEKARVALEAAIRNHPSYAIALENLGDVYVGLAAQAYARAQAMDAANAGVGRKLALAREIATGAGKATGSGTASAPPTGSAPPGKP
jgi:tetratricopeptide (TPR) repeat protein